MSAATAGAGPGRAGPGRAGPGRAGPGRAGTAMAVLLAACAGSADVFALFGLGRAFASVVTGNLVTASYGVATGNPALVKPTLTAVAGFIIGEIGWAWMLRVPRAALPLLLSELLIFLGVFAGWQAASTHPSRIFALILLALVAMAMGGQSTWALRIHQTTTYFTGMLTEAISAASAGSTGRARVGVRQLGALLGGGVVSGIVLSQARPAAPAVPLVLLAAAIVVHITTR